MRDSGLGVSDPIGIEVDPADINDRPALTEHTVVLTPAETGLPIRFQLVAHNLESSSASPVSRFTIAAIPNKPPGIVSFRYSEKPYLNSN
jgi:hypothetical protein